MNDEADNFSLAKTVVLRLAQHGTLSPVAKGGAFRGGSCNGGRCRCAYKAGRLIRSVGRISELHIGEDIQKPAGSISLPRAVLSWRNSGRPC